MPSAKSLAITAVVAIIAIAIAKRVPVVKDYL
jgi:hypothetical protein